MDFSFFIAIKKKNYRVLLLSIFHANAYLLDCHRINKNLMKIY
jgi:hypothetical protein